VKGAHLRTGVRLAAAAALAALALAALAPLRSASAPRAAPHLLPVPIISQATPFTCGPAALMAALIYFGVFDDPESRLDTDLHATPEEGVDPQRLAAEARAFGLEAEVRTGLTFDDLASELARGSLVILALQAWPSRPVADPATEWEDGHYVVLVGLDDERVYAMDPSVRTGYGYVPRQEFLKRWHDYDVRNGRRETYERLGIVLRGRRAVQSYPAEPTLIE
jgi:predicted double-glycine peptidase